VEKVVTRSARSASVSLAWFYAIAGAIVVGIAAAFGGCATMFQPTVNLPPVADQTLEYYPRQVKGYQNSYPPRRILVIPTVDAREFKDPSAIDHAPDAQGNPRIGVVLDRGHQVLQRVYGQPLGPTVQRALASAAAEAGMVSFVSDDSLDAALKKTNLEYVLQGTLTGCWVKKQRGPDGANGITWATSADFAVDVALYKPPFHTAFWQGVSSSTYDDPPLTNFLSGPEDDTSIYDEPGEVLSVALTRAVANTFRRSDLRALILDDVVLRR
jgi:hypothetical protein